ncbi:MAG: SpoIIE family protein phosphatase [Gammaproteobacteria bacterium]|nr:SpoIIE family protein phosphatase [Gammaproteobacteria bacterium]
MRVLLVDDTRTNVLVVRRYLEQMGHEVEVAENGAIAVAAVRANTPDLVLMDVMMPVMDGHEATRQIRNVLGEEWVPIIFLSARVQDSDLAEGIHSGGDDYLIKPVSKIVLQAKIAAMERIARMRELLKRQAREIAEQSSREAEEFQIAQSVFRQLNRLEEINEPRLSILSAPSSSFNGDIVAVARTPGGRLHVLLGDAMGHGLAAGLTTLPVTDTFYSMTARDCSIRDLVIALNSKLNRVLLKGRFVAAIVVGIDTENGEIEAWNGGCPPALCIDADGSTLQDFPSASLALGIVGPAQFNPEITTFDSREAVDPRLYLYSDGVSEARGGEFEATEFGVERLRNCLSHIKTRDSRSNRAKQVFAQVQAHAGAELIDDMTLVEVCCGNSFTGF